MSDEGRLEVEEEKKLLAEERSHFEAEKSEFRKEMVEALAKVRAEGEIVTNKCSKYAEMITAKYDKPVKQEISGPEQVSTLTEQVPVAESPKFSGTIIY